jgi:uroporphyrinogen-III synthase
MLAARALAGATVVITRPAPTAEPLVRGVRARGGTPVRLPGLRLAATEDVPAARRALSAAREFPLWVFTSPAAVRYYAQLAEPHALPAATQVFAVGAGTARALGRLGIDAIAPAQHHNSDALLAEAGLTDVRGRSIALIDAPGGRDLLAPVLRDRGARVERLHVYRRLPPRLEARHFQRLECAERPWLSLVSSGFALSQLLAALPSELVERWRREALIVSSARLAEQARDAGFADIHVAASALSADLLDCACSVLSQHRL